VNASVEHHVSGVVDDHVEAAGLLDDCGDRVVDRRLVGDIHLDRAQGDVVLGCVGPGIGVGLQVAAGQVPHPGVDDVACFGECSNGEGAEAAGGPGDDDCASVHVGAPFDEGTGQPLPPLA